MKTVYGLGSVSHMNEKTGVRLAVEVPPPLCNDYDRPDKETAVQNLLSRFNQNQLHGNQCSSRPDQETQI